MGTQGHSHTPMSTELRMQFLRRLLRIEATCSKKSATASAECPDAFLHSTGLQCCLLDREGSG
jgi:hypothetical protein